MNYVMWEIQSNCPYDTKMTALNNAILGFGLCVMDIAVVPTCMIFACFGTQSANFIVFHCAYETVS